MAHESESANKGSWRSDVFALLDARAITMLFLGFSAGLPILMIFSSLSLWLREAGVERSAVTFFSWAALGYSFKFVWAPLVDKLPIPFLTGNLGRRRSWMLVSQIMVMVSIAVMASIDPAAENSKAILGLDNLTFMAVGAVLLGFSSATQDIVIDAFRIESAEEKMQAILSATYIAGYRIGMLVSGAGALFLAAYFGTKMGSYDYTAWKWTYLIMACFMLVGVITTLARPEPEVRHIQHDHSTMEYFRFFWVFFAIILVFIFSFFKTAGVSSELSSSLYELFSNKALSSFVVGTLRLCFAVLACVFAAWVLGKSRLVNMDMVNDAYVGPVRNFFDRYGRSLAWTLLLLIGLYRISDIVLGVISNVFYQDLGFSKEQIASVVKTFGLIMSLVGGFLGGILTKSLGVYPMLLWGAILAAATNLLFMILADVGNNLPMLYLVISADNLAAGLASAAFVAFLSSLTDVKFTAIQYAIFTSLMTLFPKILGGYSGSMVEQLDYSGFFLLTTLMGVPVIGIVWLCQKKFKIGSSINTE